MEVDPAHFQKRKKAAEETYARQKSVYCPYFATEVVLNSDGFHHLQFSARRERSKPEQLLKFRLLPLALQVIRKSGTVQEYRTTMLPVGKKSAVDGSVRMKQVEDWGLAAIMGEKPVKIRVILRRIGDGNTTFWSVMPDSKIKNGQQKLYGENIEDET